MMFGRKVRSASRQQRAAAVYYITEEPVLKEDVLASHALLAAPAPGLGRSFPWCPLVVIVLAVYLIATFVCLWVGVGLSNPDIILGPLMQDTRTGVLPCVCLVTAVGTGSRRMSVASGLVGRMYIVERMEQWFSAPNDTLLLAERFFMPLTPIYSNSAIYMGAEIPLVSPWPYSVSLLYERCRDAGLVSLYVAIPQLTVYTTTSEVLEAGGLLLPFRYDCVFPPGFPSIQPGPVDRCCGFDEADDGAISSAFSKSWDDFLRSGSNPRRRPAVDPDRIRRELRAGLLPGEVDRYPIERSRRNRNRFSYRSPADDDDGGDESSRRKNSTAGAAAVDGFYKRAAAVISSSTSVMTPDVLKRSGVRGVSNSNEHGACSDKRSGGVGSADIEGESDCAAETESEIRGESLATEGGYRDEGRRHTVEAWHGESSRTDSNSAEDVGMTKIGNLHPTTSGITKAEIRGGREKVIREDAASGEDNHRNHHHDHHGHSRHRRHHEDNRGASRREGGDVAEEDGRDDAAVLLLE